MNRYIAAAFICLAFCLPACLGSNESTGSSDGGVAMGSADGRGARGGADGERGQNAAGGADGAGEMPGPGGLAESCIDAVPAELVFDSGEIGSETHGMIAVESCGMEPFALNSVEVTIGREHFRIPSAAVDNFLPAYFHDPDSPETAAAGLSMSFPVIFTPDAEMDYEGLIVINSNVPSRPLIQLPLRGRGVRNQCPQAVVERIELNIQPLDGIVLDGSRSVDPDGPDGLPVRYEWVVVQRPDGSTSLPLESFRYNEFPMEGGPPDDPSTPRARFFVDLAGTYVFELRVVDQSGVMAPSEDCPQEPAQVVVHADPTEDIHLQLVWNASDPIRRM